MSFIVCSRAGVWEREAIQLTFAYRIRYSLRNKQEAPYGLNRPHNASKDLSKVMDHVNDDHCPVIVTRQKGRAAVLMSFDDFKSYEETAYFMRSSKNAERLDAAIADLEAGKGMGREIGEG